MLKKKFTTGLLAILMLFGGFVFSNTPVNAAGINGWVQSNGTWYYFQNGTAVKNSWVKDSNGWCFLSSVDGSLVQEGWAQDSTGWGYIRNGYWVQHSTWAKDSKGWLHIGDNGYWDGKPAVSTMPTENTTIAAPTGLTAIAVSSGDIAIQWNAVQGADYYYLYFCDSLDGTYIPFGGYDDRSPFQWSPEYSTREVELAPNTTRYYKVTAVKNGVESSFSDIVSATTFSN